MNASGRWTTICFGILLAATPISTEAQSSFIHKAPRISQAGLPKRPPPFVKPCDRYEKEEPAVSVSRLAKDRLLWIRTCGASDYNKLSRLYLTDERGKKPAELVDDDQIPTSELEIEGSLGADSRTNVAFDPTTRVMTSTVYDTPQRDSGERSEWVLEGSRFRYARRSSLGQTLKRGLKHEHWPVTYQARVVDP
ncbi:DUF1176 domain-containing protein [Caulobacter sp. DWP3-1-3b2]|uniref:DUF1176 domain-containing protein n=1 Tax=Caulobacter sp. DWP3-1-3b2 TaxID=2804643 RepID=UPI003CF05CD6